MGTLNPGTYEASYYQSQSNKFLGIKTLFVDPDTDPYSWIVTDNLMGFNAMIMNRLGNIKGIDKNEVCPPQPVHQLPMST